MLCCWGMYGDVFCWCECGCEFGVGNGLVVVL